MNQRLKAEPPKAPQLKLEAYPLVEQSHIGFVNERLRALEKYANSFASAVALHHFMKFKLDKATRSSSNLTLEWCLIPCRDACMSLYHYCKTIENFSLGAECPTFRENVDTSKLREVRREFRQRFPSIEQFRTAISHASEINETPEKYKKNNFTRPDGTTIRATNSIINGKFSQTFDGSLLEVEITHQNVLVINRLTAQFFSAFDNA